MSTVDQGRHGEDRAARLLRSAGMAILERNYRGAGAEIDIVARDGTLLVFVETRTRTRADRGSALETVTVAKQRRIARAAAHYLAFRRPTSTSGITGIRFDVIGITAGDVVHIKDAFRINS